MSLSKAFPLTERVKVNLRGEFFNALNHANFNAPAASVAGAGFGTIRTGREPRIVQVALKVTF